MSSLDIILTRLTMGFLSFMGGFMISYRAPSMRSLTLSTFS